MASENTVWLFHSIPCTAHYSMPQIHLMPTIAPFYPRLPRGEVCLVYLALSLNELVELVGGGGGRGAHQDDALEIAVQTLQLV